MPASVKSKAMGSLLILPIFVFACTSNPTTNNNPPPPPAVIPPPLSLNGVWSMTIKVTVATQDCDGEVGQQSTEDITFNVAGSSAPYSVVASGFLGVPGNSLSGSMNAQGLITISGSYPEENEGTTVTTHTLQRTSETTLAGSEAWSWSDTFGNSCPGSAATVTAIKN